MTCESANDDTEGQPPAKVRKQEEKEIAVRHLAKMTAEM